MADRHQDCTNDNALVVVAKDREPQRCEFCDITLKSDSDTTRHINSFAHRQKQIQYIQNHDKYHHAMEKQIPKDIPSLFKALNIKTVSDLRDLADRRFFDLKSNSQVKLIQYFVRMLGKTWSIFEIANSSMDPVMKERFLARMHQNSLKELEAPSTDRSGGTLDRCHAPECDQTSSTSSMRTNHPSRQTKNPQTAKGRSDLPSTSGSSARKSPHVQRSSDMNPGQSTSFEARSDLDLRTHRARLQKDRSKEEKQSNETIQMPKVTSYEPDPNSKYVPKLATVKIEPKDRD